jgi:hypothetical protein
MSVPTGKFVIWRMGSLLSHYTSSPRSALRFGYLLLRITHPLMPPSLAFLSTNFGRLYSAGWPPAIRTTRKYSRLDFFPHEIIYQPHSRAQRGESHAP